MSTLAPVNAQSLVAGAVGNAAGGASSVSPATLKKIDAVATDFEAVFLTEMLGPMFSGDDMTAYFGGGTAGDVYKGYLLTALGKSMAEAGGIGIGQQVKQELLKLQETSA